MSSNIASRLGRLESSHGRKETVFWINKGDGILHGPSGQTMTEEEFHKAYPGSKTLTLTIA